MAISWPCDWFVNLRRRQRRSQGVSCETLSERSSTSNQSESTAAGSIGVSCVPNGRKKGRILNAVSKMRDAYVGSSMTRRPTFATSLKDPRDLGGPLGLRNLCVP
ncbi:hypothetical protein R1sor_016373 [Riccia sorocarpa]|uniref:Uncharacterized protein n=1 Tax=Riccia sorocarpa TaxID=122646 RepID=A0ABD3HL13_9MARC